MRLCELSYWKLQMLIITIIIIIPMYWLHIDTTEIQG